MTRFRNNTAIARITILFSVLVLFFSMTMLVINIYQFPVSTNTANYNMTAPGNIVLFLYSLITYTQAILFTIWFYRVYNNLRIVSPEHKKYASWLIVVSWFLPLVALILPYLAVNGVRRAYNKVLPVGNIFQRSRILLNVWWTCFGLATNGGYVFWGCVKILDLHFDSSIYLAVDCFTIALHFIGVIFSILIIRNINKLENLFQTFSNKDESSIFSTISHSSTQSFD